MQATDSRVRNWWREKALLGKAILILAAILVIQIALALSTGMLLWAYMNVTGRIVNIERPILLVIAQLIFSLPTLVLLIIAITVRVIQSRRQRVPVMSILPPPTDRPGI